MAATIYKSRIMYEGYLLAEANIVEAAAWCGGTVIEAGDPAAPVAIDIPNTLDGGYVRAGIGDYVTKDLAGNVQAWIAAEFLAYNQLASDYGASPTFSPTQANPGTNATVSGAAALSGNNNGGSAVIQGGAKAGSGLDGIVKLKGTVSIDQGAPSAKTTAVTLTTAEILTKIITGTHSAGATAAYTLPTGTDVDAAVQLATGESVDWVLINLSAAAVDTITLTANTDHTIVGNPIVQSAHSSTGGIYGNSAQFRTRRTGAHVYVTYRIA